MYLDKAILLEKLAGLVLLSSLIFGDSLPCLSRGLDEQAAGEETDGRCSARADRQSRAVGWPRPWDAPRQVGNEGAD